MARRLRHVDTGEVFGWNHEMAKLPELEEFDDEDPDAEFERVKKTPDVRGRVTGTVVGDQPPDADVLAAASKGEAALDVEEVTEEVTADEEEGSAAEEYYLADDDGEPIL